MDCTDAADDSVVTARRRPGICVNLRAHRTEMRSSNHRAYRGAFGAPAGSESLNAGCCAPPPRARRPRARPGSRLAVARRVRSRRGARARRERGARAFGSRLRAGPRDFPPSPRHHPWAWAPRPVPPSARPRAFPRGRPPRNRTRRPRAATRPASARASRPFGVAAARRARRARPPPPRAATPRAVVPAPNPIRARRPLPFRARPPPCTDFCALGRGRSAPYSTTRPGAGS